MPSYSYPTDNGKYDFLITLTLENSTVAIREHRGLHGDGELVSEEIHQFSSEAKAQEFYLSQCRRDRYYQPPSEEELALQRGEAVYLEFADGTSHKFYEVTVTGLEVVARYGRVGTKGQSYRTVETTLEGAIAAGLRKLQEKQRKGYVQPCPPGSVELPELIADPGTQVLAGTVRDGEDLLWQTPQLRPGCVVRLTVRVYSLSFSFNLMAENHYAYHFNPRPSEKQIVQNTMLYGHWGSEERLPLPAEICGGQEFELAIAIHPEELIVYLNNSFLCRYRHRVPPNQITGLRLACRQGHLEIPSIKLATLPAEVGVATVAPDAEKQPQPPVSTTGEVLEWEDAEEFDPPERTIEQFARSAWLPIVEAGDRQLTASKFSGRPWLAQHESWFNCPCCAQPLQLFVQLNLGELPDAVRGEYGTGLLQVFRCVSEDCGGQYSDISPVVFYGRSPNLEQNALVRLVNPQGTPALPPLPAIAGEPYETYFPAQTITGWQAVDDYPDLDELAALVQGWATVKNGGSADWDALFKGFGFVDLEDFEDSCPETVEGDKLSGYPCWSQDMEYAGCPLCEAPMRQVLQLGSNDHLPYQFGDMGTAHVLQCPTHREQFAFVWACS